MNIKIFFQKQVNAGSNYAPPLIRHLAAPVAAGNQSRRCNVRSPQKQLHLMSIYLLETQMIGLHKKSRGSRFTNRILKIWPNFPSKSGERVEEVGYYCSSSAQKGENIKQVHLVTHDFLLSLFFTLEPFSNFFFFPNIVLMIFNIHQDFFKVQVKSL